MIRSVLDKIDPGWEDRCNARSRADHAIPWMLREVPLYVRTASIPDRPILEFLARQTGWSTHGPGHIMPTVQDAMPAGTPVDVQHAKMCTLATRGLVTGCTCGCRGDWELVQAGRDIVEPFDPRDYYEVTDA
jgi:hypothetical protein